MTKVVFRTFGQISQISKCNQASIEFPGKTVKQFLDALEKKYGSQLHSILYLGEEDPSPMIYILLNGKNVQQLRGMDTALKDGDIVSVLPVTAGG